MKSFLALLIFLAGCSSLPDTTTGARNACLPEAAMMCEALRGKGIEARVLLLETPEFSHALAIYLYPPGQNKLWAWDSHWKSLRIRAFSDDPEGIALAWLKKTHPEKQLIRSDFL